jgi:hypothetical protein
VVRILLVLRFNGHLRPATPAFYAFRKPIETTGDPRTPMRELAEET